jgi:hypothetical protein
MAADTIQSDVNEHFLMAEQLGRSPARMRIRKRRDRAFGGGGLSVVSIRIIDWDEEKAWAAFASYHPRDLERRLVRLTGQGRGEVKHLVRQLKHCECITFALPEAEDRFAAESLRGFLESVGAVVSVEDAERAAAPDRGGIT